MTPMSRPMTEGAVPMGSKASAQNPSARARMTMRRPVISTIGPPARLTTKLDAFMAVKMAPISA